MSHKRKHESNENDFLFQIPPSSSTSRYWETILCQAFEGRDRTILDTITNSNENQIKQIQTHLTFVPHAFRYILFLLDEIHLKNFERQALPDDLLFCITQSLILREKQEKISHWVRQLHEQKFCRGEEEVYLGQIFQHYLNKEEGIIQGRIENENALMASPTLTLFEWDVIFYLSSSILDWNKRIRLQNRYHSLPFCFTVAYGNRTWSPGKFFPVSFALCLTVDQFRLHDAISFAKQNVLEKCFIEIIAFMRAYHSSYKLLSESESKRIGEVICYLAEKERYRTGDEINLCARKQRGMSFDPSNLYHPHVWIFWFQLIVLNYAPPSSIFYQTNFLLQLFYKTQLRMCKNVFLRQLTSSSSLTLDHVLLVKKSVIQMKKPTKLTDCICSLFKINRNVASFLKKFQLIEDVILENFFPSVLWNFITEYII